ncbi:MAG: UbiA family prenyltransferase [Pyrinomonadaceae bacterium]
MFRKTARILKSGFARSSSGALSIPLAILSAGLFLFIASGIAASLNRQFVMTSAIYCVLMVGYSITLKRVMILDCMIIASGFVLRVVGGAVAAGVHPSHWLMVCAFLLALYLAFSKRRQELLMLSGAAATHRHVLGAYTVSYLDQVNNILIGHPLSVTRFIP